MEVVLVKPWSQQGRDLGMFTLLTVTQTGPQSLGPLGPPRSNTNL